MLGDARVWAIPLGYSFGLFLWSMVNSRREVEGLWRDAAAREEELSEQCSDGRTDDLEEDEHGH